MSNPFEDFLNGLDLSKLPASHAAGPGPPLEPDPDWPAVLPASGVPYAVEPDPVKAMAMVTTGRFVEIWALAAIGICGGNPYTNPLPAALVSYYRAHLEEIALFTLLTGLEPGPAWEAYYKINRRQVHMEVALYLRVLGFDSDDLAGFVGPQS